MSARHILFVVSIYNYHREVFPVVEEFCRAGWNVAVLIGWIGRVADETQAQYARLGCEIVRPSPEFGYGDPDAAQASGRHAATPKPPARGIARLRILRGQLRYCVRMKREMYGTLRRLKPDAIFCGPFHSCGMLDNAVAAWARKYRVPMYCYPVSAYHGEVGAVRARFQNLRMGMVPPSISVGFDWLNRLIASLFPAWTRTSGPDAIFMWEPMRMLAARSTGLLERNTWQKPAEAFRCTFVFSRFSERLLRESRYPMDKVFVVGVPLLDRVFARIDDKAHERALKATLGMEEERDFILFNVEPSAEHHYADWDLHWKNFRAMMVMVTRRGLPVVLSLHPLCRERDYAFAEQEFGVRIARGQKIYDLYPYCRVCVSFPCSTNLVAELFNKPLVIYDFFGMTSPSSGRQEEYRLPGAEIGYSAEEAGEALDRVLKTSPRQPALPGTMRAAHAMRSRVEADLAAATS